MTKNKDNLPDKTSHAELEIDSGDVSALYESVSGHIDRARNKVQRSINTEMVRAYWLIGRDIVEYEQKGESRADYGESVLIHLSVRLTEQYGRGFGVRLLEDIRRFFLTYQDVVGNEKSHTLCAISDPQHLNENLSWSHYRILIRVDRAEARAFYEQEATNNNWSVRELERQIGSLLFDRLAKSKDKEGLLELAHKGQEINKPEDGDLPIFPEYLHLRKSVILQLATM